MTRIRLTRSGLNVAGASRARGEEVDVDSDVAAYLTSSGQAMLVRSTRIETTVASPGETTSAGPARPRRTREATRAAHPDR